jgi:hypothetical protein
MARYSKRLEAHGDSHAATDAKRGKTFLRTTTLHLEQKRIEDAGTGRSDRMANGDRASVDVDD